jgi:hypothetical protein
MSNVTNSAKLKVVPTSDDQKIATPYFRVCQATGRAFRSLIGVVAIIGGGLIWHYAHELMLRQIYLIGEENALGRENVIRLADGGTLLTNPGAMIFYELPFLGGAVLLIILGSWLLYREYKAIVSARKGR